MHADLDVHAERRLMAAVLEDAVRTVLHARRAAGVKQVRQELHWFASTERRDPFAFERVCEALDIDPSYLRRRLFAGTLPPQAPKRASTTFGVSPMRA